MENPRICRACLKLINYHTEAQIKECRKVEDKRRQTIGRIAYSQCLLVNPDNPQAVAEAIKPMYEALINLKQLRNKPLHFNEKETLAILEQVDEALALAERKG